MHVTHGKQCPESAIRCHGWSDHYSCRGGDKIPRPGRELGAQGLLPPPSRLAGLHGATVQALVFGASLTISGLAMGGLAKHEVTPEGAVESTAGGSADREGTRGGRVTESPGFGSGGRALPSRCRSAAASLVNARTGPACDAAEYAALPSGISAVMESSAPSSFADVCRRRMSWCCPKCYEAGYALEVIGDSVVRVG